MNKRRFRSWKEAEDAERTASLQSSIAQEALNSAVACHINWLKDGAYEVALISAERAHGGIVLVRYCKYVSAHSAPLWADEHMRLTGLTKDENSLRSLAFKLKEMMQRVDGALRLSKEIATMAIPPGNAVVRHVINGKKCEGDCD